MTFLPPRTRRTTLEHKQRMKHTTENAEHFSTFCHLDSRHIRVLRERSSSPTILAPSFPRSFRSLRDTTEGLSLRCKAIQQPRKRIFYAILNAPRSGERKGDNSGTISRHSLATGISWYPWLFNPGVGCVRVYAPDQRGNNMSSGDPNAS